jgi:hypothetical protein
LNHLGHYLVGATAVLGGLFLIVRGELARRSGRAPDVPDLRPPDARPATEVTRASDAMTSAALLSVGAGVIHAFVIADHFEEAASFGTFFVVLAVAQLGWAVALWRSPSRRLLVAAAIGSLLVAALWLVSRTVGLPVGPERWEAEPVGLADAVSTAFEILTTALAVVALRARAPLSFVRPVFARTLPAVTAGAVIGLTYLAAATGSHH